MSARACVWGGGISVTVSSLSIDDPIVPSINIFVDYCNRSRLQSSPSLVDTTSNNGTLTTVHKIQYTNYSTVTTVTAGKCNWRHFGWSVRLVGFPQCYLTCRFLTNKIFYLIQVWVVFQNEKEEG